MFFIQLVDIDNTSLDLNRKIYRKKISVRTYTKILDSISSICNAF